MDRRCGKQESFPHWQFGEFELPRAHGALRIQFQETTNLSLANSWSPVAQPAVTNAGQISVTIPTTVGRMFFRLKSQ